MEPSTPKEIERPDWVWFLLIVYSIGVVLRFGGVALMALLPNGRFDVVALGISLLVMVLRGVGLLRLFFFKRDAWVYLALALLIMVGSDALDLLLGGTDFFLQRHAILGTLAGYAGATIVTAYAFRIGNVEPAKKT